MTDYPWYTIAGTTDGLNQGDFVFSCPILEPIHDLETEKIKANYSEYDVIIMSQSCDLVNEKLDIVLVCPFWTLSDIEKRNPWFTSGKNKEKLRKGDQAGYHLLNKVDVPGFDLDFIVVDFRNVPAPPPI